MNSGYLLNSQLKIFHLNMNWSTSCYNLKSLTGNYSAALNYSKCNCKHWSFVQKSSAFQNQDNWRQFLFKSYIILLIPLNHKQCNIIIYVFNIVRPDKCHRFVYFSKRCIPQFIWTQGWFFSRLFILYSVHEVIQWDKIILNI